MIDVENDVGVAEDVVTIEDVVLRDEVADVEPIAEEVSVDDIRVLEAILLELRVEETVELTTVEESEEAAAGLYRYKSSLPPAPQYSEELPLQSMEQLPASTATDPAERVFPQ